MAREQLLAWLPFVAAIALAFAVGFVFARICQGRSQSRVVSLPRPLVHVRRGGARLAHERHVEIGDGITVAAVYLALFILWTIVALFVWRMVR